MTTADKRDLTSRVTYGVGLMCVWAGVVELTQCMFVIGAVALVIGILLTWITILINTISAKEDCIQKHIRVNEQMQRDCAKLLDEVRYLREASPQAYFSWLLTKEINEKLKWYE